MIYIDKELVRGKKKEKFTLKLQNEEDFLEVVHCLKEYSKLKYNKDLKRYEGNKKNLILTLYYIKKEGFEYKLVYSDKVKKEDLELKREVKRVRRKVDYTYMNYKPLEGKNNYQETDLNKFIMQNRGGIFWDVGLGKAYFIAVTLTNLFQIGEIQRALIITPSDGLINIKREILKHSKYFKEEDFVIGNRYERKPFQKQFKIVIMTFNTFRMISDDYYKLKNKGKLSKKYRSVTIDFDKWIDKENEKACLILDESHSIGNWTSRQTKTIHIHKDFFEYRYLFSGTPADKFEKYYSQIRLLDESLCPESFSDWKTKYFEVGNSFSPYAITSSKTKEQNEFLQKLNGLCIRRKAINCLDLPTHQIKNIYCQMTQKQRRIYNLLCKDELKEIAKENNGLIMSKDLIQRSKQILNLVVDNPELLKKNLHKYESNKELYKLIKGFNFKKDHGKLEILDNMITKLIGNTKEKLIIWDYHPLSLDNLYNMYSTKYNSLLLHGEARGKMDKDEYFNLIINKFKNDKDIQILFASFLVLKQAVTLTECNKQIYFTRNNNYIDITQSMGRIYRNSQDRKTFTYNLIFENSLDERIDKNLKNKGELNDKEFKDNRAYSKEEVIEFLGLKKD